MFAQVLQRNLFYFKITDMNIEELQKRIKETKSIKDKGERLMELNYLAEDIANHFTESMSYLEYEIEFVLNRTPQKIKDELGYQEVFDVTRNISPMSSWDY
jgi:hypothetical protein